MYVRVLNFVCRADVGEDDIHETYQTLRRHAETMDGFLGSTLLMSDESCRGMALMYWRDPEAASSAGPRLVGLLSERIHRILDHPPEISGYHLVAGQILSEEYRE